MKKSTLIMFFVLVPLVSFGQDLLELALEDKSSIIISKPFKFTFDSSRFHIQRYMRNINLQDIVLTDTTVVLNLVKLSRSQDSSFWTDEELKKVVLVNKDEKVNFKAAFDKMKPSSKEATKKLKKEIRKYNNRHNEWRSYPISLSKPNIFERWSVCIYCF